MDQMELKYGKPNMGPNNPWFIKTQRDNLQVQRRKIVLAQAL